MNLLTEINNLSDAIKETEEYQSYKEAKDNFENSPESRGLLNDFKKAKSELAILKDGGFSGVERQQKKVDKLSNQVLDNKEIQEYLRSKKNYQKLVGQIAATLSDKIDFPVHKPKKKSCCG